jgi:hypothetical protein
MKWKKSKTTENHIHEHVITKTGKGEVEMEKSLGNVWRISGKAITKFGIIKFDRATYKRKKSDANKTVMQYKKIINKRI